MVSVTTYLPLFTITALYMDSLKCLGNERPATFYHNRVDKPNKDRGQRVRKLQLSDVDW